jgi:hypothetical protein
MPLPRALPLETEAPAPPVLSRATRTAPPPRTIERAPTLSPTPPMPSAPPVRLPVPPPPVATPVDEPADDVEGPPLLSEGTWRDRLCAWSELVMSDPRRTLALPDLDDAAPLADAIERLDLDAHATRALALLYGARLWGEASLPAALLARALANGAAPTEREWDEALGRGVLTRLGLLRARNGRVQLRPQVADFLDGAPPRLKIIDAGEGALDTPPGAAVHEAGEASEAEVGASLAERFGCRVALVPLPPVDARLQIERALVEARLHNAWPLLSGTDPAAWLELVRSLPSVILVRGVVPPSLASLPRV